jgi:gamma-glutamyltranspeptidase/glutathione hydrolase
MCGLAGMASAHVYDAARHEACVLDGGHTIGSKATPTVFAEGNLGRIGSAGSFLVRDDLNATGYQAIMTPGFVPTLEQLHLRFGSGQLSWQTLVEPAAALAAEGFMIYPQIARYYTPSYRGLGGVRRTLREQLAGCPVAHDILLKRDGSGYRNGEWIRLPDLAGTLARIAHDGPQSFYRGDIARQIAADLEAHCAFVTYEDMASFSVDLRVPAGTTYRSHTITSTPPPGRGLAELLALKILEGYDLARLGRLSPDHAELVALALQCAFRADLDLPDGSPSLPTMSARLLSSEHIDSCRAELDQRRVRPVEQAGSSVSDSDIGTTHLTVMDSQGNTVSITHSIGGAAGAGVVTDGLGVFYNNHMLLFNPLPGTNDSIVPGKKRNKTEQSIIYRDGEPVLAAGGAGGTRILSGMVQVIINVLDHQLTPAEAVSAPRIHSEGGNLILLEPGWPDSTVAALRKRGYQVQPEAFLGWIHPIVRDPVTGELNGSSDTRGAEGRGWVGYYAGTD